MHVRGAGALRAPGSGGRGRARARERGDGGRVSAPSVQWWAASATAAPAEERILPRRRDDAGDADDDDPEGAYLLARSREIEAYVSSCRNADLAKAERRRQEEREARRPFAPPLAYS